MNDQVQELSGASDSRRSLVILIPNTKEMNTTTSPTELPATTGSPSGGWIKVGWIKNPPVEACLKTFEELKNSAMRSDHGEERMVIDRPNGSGADCYYREANDQIQP